jgi:hypothetical protein
VSRRPAGAGSGPGVGRRLAAQTAAGVGGRRRGTRRAGGRPGRAEDVRKAPGRTAQEDVLNIGAPTGPQCSTELLDRSSRAGGVTGTGGSPRRLADRHRDVGIDTDPPSVGTLPWREGGLSATKAPRHPPRPRKPATSPSFPTGSARPCAVPRETLTSRAFRGGHSLPGSPRNARDAPRTAAPATNHARPSPPSAAAPARTLASTTTFLTQYSLNCKKPSCNPLRCLMKGCRHRSQAGPPGTPGGAGRRRGHPAVAGPLRRRRSSFVTQRVTKDDGLFRRRYWCCARVWRGAAAGADPDAPGRWRSPAPAGRSR